jgi:hypothetical protein
MNITNSPELWGKPSREDLLEIQNFWDLRGSRRKNSIYAMASRLIKSLRECGEI